MATGFTTFDTIAMKRSYACFNFSESTYRLKIVFQFDRTVYRRVCEMLIDIMLLLIKTHVGDAHAKM